MQLSKFDTLADKVNLNGKAANAIIGDVYRFLKPTNEGLSPDLPLWFHFNKAVTGGGTDFSFELVTATNEALTTGAVTLLRTGKFTAATAKVGATFICYLPSGSLAQYKTYLGVTLNRQAAITAGEVSIGFAPAPFDRPLQVREPGMF